MRRDGKTEIKAREQSLDARRRQLAEAEALAGLGEHESRLLARLAITLHSAEELSSALAATLQELCDQEQWDYGELWLPTPDGQTLACHLASYARRPEQMRAFREHSQQTRWAPGVGLPGRVWTTGRPEWRADLCELSEGDFCRAELAHQAALGACVGVPLRVGSHVVAVLVLIRHAPCVEDARQLDLLLAVAAQLAVIIRRRQAEEALKHSEERFRLAARATSDVIYDWDLDANKLWLSEAVTRNFGHPNKQPESGWWTALIHPDDASRIRAALSSALDSGATFWSNEYRFRRADGSYADVFDRRYISRDASGSPTRMIGSLLDISERARGALSLRKAKESAEAAARAKSQFLANMSHEIRTPLTAVLGFADQLLEPRLSERDRLEYVMTIRRNGEHLLSILNDILDLSKVEAGKLSVEHIPCAPAEVLRDVAALMRVRAVEKGLSFELAHETPIPKLVRTDPTRLRQIVLNLVSNAIKFTDHGSVRVTAGYAPSDGGRHELRIVVSDTGIGMDRVQLGRLFQPFSQADPSMTRRYGGSGLGLGISGPLAAALGGGITVESEPGRGSTFVLRIPVDAVAEQVGSEPDDAHRASESELAPPAVGEGRVLLAEDGRDNQLLIGMLLRKQGLEVEVVDNGRTAVERAVEATQRGTPFDVVLMDMQMPELDGYAASAELRSCGYTRPIVALTAHAMTGEREHCLNAGCDDYLTKPIEQSRLIALVRAHVHAQKGDRSARLTLTNGSGNARVPRDFAQRGGHERLISLFAHDPDMAEIVAGFVRGLPIQVAALWAAHARADRSLLSRLAHQLKGAAGGYGFPTITEAAAELEDLAKSEAPVHQALTELVERCERTQRSERPPSLEPEKLGEPARILAIDDSPMIQQLIEVRLRAENVHVLCALSATEGLALAREQPPDLILLDLNLPDASGFDVCRALQSDPATAFVPVLFLTSNADPSTKAAALDLGAVDYVTKPFDATELRARVRSALRTKHYQDLLATRAQVDGLTGLWNRAHFDARLVDELAAAERHARPLALAMLDLDHFKRINDTYGHPFGDQVLQAVAGVLTKTVRSSDLVCRYGGEEFVAILRETGVDAALASAQRLRTAMSKLSLSSGSQSIDVTISLGVVAIEPPYDEHNGELSPSILVGAADAALYQAKRGGRDRVVLSTPPLR